MKSGNNKEYSKLIRFQELMWCVSAVLLFFIIPVPIVFMYFQLKWFWYAIWLIIFFSLLIIDIFIGYKNLKKWSDNHFLKIKKLFFLRRCDFVFQNDFLIDSGLHFLEKDVMYWKEKSWIWSRGTVCLLKNDTEGKNVKKYIKRKIKNHRCLNNLNCIALVSIAMKRTVSDLDLQQLTDDALDNYRPMQTRGLIIIPAIYDDIEKKLYYVDMNKKYGMEVFFMGFRFLRKFKSDVQGCGNLEKSGNEVGRN